MKVCVVGVGYVGLVTGVCLAQMGNDVICVDNNINKLNNLKNGVVTIYEPNLEELLLANIKEDRLCFTSNIDFAVKNSDICFIAVGTPQKSDGNAELKYVYEVAKSIAKSIDKYKIIVNKSTVPVGCADKVKQIIKKYTDIEFDVISNPEFLKQGNAVNDFLKPDRIIIGHDSTRALNIMKELYSPFVRTGNPIITMDIKSAELTKYTANAFLAMKISFMNQIANIAESTGADIDSVRKGISADDRIGSKFLFAGIGYGGSCFPKDVKALINIAKANNCEYDLLSAVDSINKRQRQKFLEKILKRFDNNLKGKTIAIWGLSFKPNTNDTREAPSLYLIDKLLKYGVNIRAYDPKAISEAKKIFSDKIKYCNGAYEALINADCLLLLTEWREFRSPDFEKMKSNLKTPIIFDGRNQYDYNILLNKGFEYYNIGRK